MPKFIIGQKVKHLLSNECLTIKKINGNVASCYIEQPYFLNKTRILIDVCVCLINNLIPIS